MPGLRRPTSMLLAAAAAAVLAACGSEESGDIPQTEGTALLDQLDSIEQAVAENNCDTARGAASDFTKQVAALPEDAFPDAEARTAVLTASDNLTQLVNENCEPTPTGATGEVDTTTTSTTEPTTTAEEETTTEEEPVTPPEDSSEDKPGNGPPETPPGQGGDGGDSGGGGTGSGGIGSED